MQIYYNTAVYITSIVTTASPPVRRRISPGSKLLPRHNDIIGRCVITTRCVVRTRILSVQRYRRYHGGSGFGRKEPRRVRPVRPPETSSRRTREQSPSDPVHTWRNGREKARVIVFLFFQEISHAIRFVNSAIAVVSAHARIHKNFVPVNSEDTRARGRGHPPADDAA